MPDEIAQSTLHLASDQNSFTTRAMLMVDGGDDLLADWDRASVTSEIGKRRDNKPGEFEQKKIAKGQAARGKRWLRKSWRVI